MKIVVTAASKHGSTAQINGDFRDWDRINHWAQDIDAELRKPRS